MCSPKSFCLDGRVLLAVGTKSDRQAVWHGWNVEWSGRGYGIRPHIRDPLPGALALRGFQASIRGRNRRNCREGELYQYIPLHALVNWVARQPRRTASR